MARETLEVGHFEKEDGSKSKVLTIPSNFRTCAIKEILTGIVWGEPTRAVWILSSDNNEAEEIPDEELKSYRELPSIDRQCALDILTIKVKKAAVATIVEEVHDK